MPGSKKAQAAADDQRRARATASDEAAELIAALRADVETLTEFLDRESAIVDKRGSTPKRLARLRLMADDLRSASKFAAKSIKN